MTEPLPADQYAGATEYEIQAALFDLARWKANQDPRWRRLVPVPNGQYRPGHRPEPGLSQGAGYPDVQLDVACGGFHGLKIELKRPGQKPRPEQREWHRWLHEQGYCVDVCHSVEEAEAVIERYLRLDGDE